jgi:type I restriction enzyme S subunit
MSFHWFGSLSSKWKVVPLREVARLGTGHTPSREVPEYWVDCTIPWVTVEDIRDHGDDSLTPLLATKQQISELGLANSAAVLHPTGTVMLSRTASIGFTCIIGRPMATTQAFVTWTPNESVLDGNFLHVALRAMGQQFYYLAYGATHLTIYFTDIKTLRIPLPPIAEQIQIAAFLARETAKIDALVAEQQGLMELLKEKRQAVISHAVTKGLNPDASMKPSGIEWLGDVPEHWEVKPMRRISSVVRGASPRPAGDPKYFGGDAVPWVTVGEITKDSGVYLVETEFFLTEEGATLSNLFKAGTLIYSNSGATLGVPKVLSIDACANDGVVAFLNLDDRVLAEFLYHCLASITDSIREKVKQGSGQPNLNTDIVKDLRFGLPPVPEQQLIVDKITALASEFDALTAESQRAIDLLQERRTALVSAAVTGQIDVRGAAIS